MWIADQPSPTLQQALQLLADGKRGEAEMLVKKAAMDAKAKHGSGSHPLAVAYADIGRLHLRMGEFQKAALEFQHASKSPMPPDAAGRRDRLGFMYGFAEALVGLTKFDEAEKVLRQCVTFAKNLHGPTSAGAAVANGPLADTLLKAGKPADAMKLAQESYDALWALGDPLITSVIPVRAESLKAAGRSDNPFTDLADLPDNLVIETVNGVIARAPLGDPGRMRAVLADLLAFVDKKFGDGHAVTCDVLAAIAHHETRQGDQADATVRRAAVRRSVWSFAVRRVPGGLLANLEIGFEPNGLIHLVPHLARDPNPTEAAQLESILNQAVDDLYARPG
ncbi:MAG: tetratricopeptide repeat protein [Planctomycetia bacterium]|nr:tetratricopeptide repeat protein [Planctomycetia bacterium]